MGVVIIFIQNSKIIALLQKCHKLHVQIEYRIYTYKVYQIFKLLLLSYFLTYEIKKIVKNGFWVC